MKPRSDEVIINGLRYNTDVSDIIASDAYWDGHNWERHGRNRYLYRTNNGRYFVQHMTCWQGELDRIEPLTKDQAISLYEEMAQLPTGDTKDFEDAFPDVVVKDA